MKKEIFFDYIKNWFWELGFLRNSYLEDLENLDTTNVVKVITWMRRVWKSFILKQFINKKINSWIKKENIFYLHLEDYRFWDNPDLIVLWELFEYFLENIYVWGDFYVFLDEIQNVVSWEKFIRTINEKYQNKAHIFITGSNSNLLSSELSTLLTWRFVSLQVYPLSFLDYLKFNNLKIESSLDTKKINYFEKYISFWSLPEILKINDENIKKNYLETLVDSILFKDIITRYKLRKTAFISSLLKFIYTNTCSLLSINSILKFLKQDIKSLDYETVDNYITYLENSFLINKLDWKNIKTKEILRSNKKYYSYDLWIRNIYSNNNDIEKIIENFVYLELKRRWYNIWVVNNSIYEIDFLAEKGNKKIYFQVSYTIKNEDTYNREIKPLLIQKDNYEKIILTLDEWEKEDRWIIIKNIIDWSLEEEKNMI
jgi:predicted AAA+ superfamily ATPase